MYKKITHNIIEEHFGMPMPEEQSTIPDGKKTMPTNEVFDETKFKQEIESYLTTYGSKIINMINQLPGTEDDVIVAFEDLFKNIDDLGNITKPFYASDLGERININMRSVALLTFIAINNLKLGRDPQNNFNRMNINLTDLAQILSSFNSLWENNAVRTILTKFISGIQAKLKAKKEKNASAEQAANLVITEQLKTFGDAFFNGIKTKFPERFIKTMPVTITDRDIM